MDMREQMDIREQMDMRRISVCSGPIKVSVYAHIHLLWSHESALVAHIQLRFIHDRSTVTDGAVLYP